MTQDKEEQVEEKERTPFDSLLKNLADHFGEGLVAYLGELKGVKS